jgi:hypothetical protein
MITHYGKLVDSYAKTFRLDLNVEPYHRWDHIVPTYKGIL